MKQGQTTLEEASGVELGEDALSGTVYEMMASSISGFPNVSLVVEDASLENMTVDQYFLAAQQMLDATGMGYTCLLYTSFYDSVKALIHFLT